jgi:hypothetical protein
MLSELPPGNEVHEPVQKEQYAKWNLMKSKRQNVWEFRRRDRTNGSAVYLRIVLGNT